MKNKILPFLVGVIFGAAIYAGGQAYLAKPEAPAATPDVVKRAELAVVENKKRAALLDQREQMLKDQEQQLADAMGQNPDAGPSGAPGKPGKDEAAAITQMTKAVIKQQMDMKMAALKSRLQLTDDQTAAIQALMDKQAQIAQDMTEKMFSGKMSKDDLTKTMQNRGNPEADMDQQLQTILTPDQYTQYQTYQNDEKKSAAESAANAEIMQIQSSLNLSEDQKDKVFTAIYQQYAQQMGVDGAKPTAASTDINAQMDAKKAAMQSVLTPEQFDTYSKFVDSQKDMVNALMNGMTKGGGTGGDSAPPAP